MNAPFTEPQSFPTIPQTTYHPKRCLPSFFETIALLSILFICFFIIFYQILEGLPVIQTAPPRNHFPEEELKEGILN